MSRWSRVSLAGLSVVVVLLLVSSTLFLVGVSSADSSGADLAEAGEQRYIVNLDRPEATSSSELERISRDRTSEAAEKIDSFESADVVREFWISSSLLVEVESGVEELELLLDDPDVTSVRAESQVEAASAATVAVDDPVEAHGGHIYAWGVDRMSAPDVWSVYDSRGEGVKVAVLDTGVNVSHPDIDLYTRDPGDETYPGGWAAFNDTGYRIEGSTPFDHDGHGTHVSGLVVAGSESGAPLGVAPEADLMHAQVLGEEKTGTVSGVLAGMEWAVENEADVVSMSLGKEAEPVFIDAVRSADDMGVYVVSAVGNVGQGSSTSPGNIYETIAVGSTDEDGEYALFSGGEKIDSSDLWGEDRPDDWPDEYVVPDVVAPGVSVTGPWADGGYSAESGTSMSTPYVSGSIALAISAYEGSPERTNVVDSLYAGSISPYDEKNTEYGHGEVNAYETTQHLLNHATVTGRVKIDGGVVDNASVRLYGSDGRLVDEQRTDSLGGYSFAPLDTGEIYTVEAEKDSASGENQTSALPPGSTGLDVTLSEEAATIDVVGMHPVDLTVEPGQGFEVHSQVKNQASASVTENVSYRVESDESTEIEFTEVVEVGAGERHALKFDVDVTTLESGSYIHGVYTEQDEKTGNLLVSGGPVDAFFDDQGEPVDDGEVIQVLLKWKDTGDINGTKVDNAELIQLLLTWYGAVR